MVDTEMVKRKLAKGLTTGVGVFASSFVGNTIEDAAPFGGTGVAASQMVLGAGVAVGSEKLGGAVSGRTGAQQGLVELGVEHIGYGIHGAGFAELADTMQTGADTDRVVTVNARSDDAQNQQNNSGSSGRAENFSLDTA